MSLQLERKSAQKSVNYFVVPFVKLQTACTGEIKMREIRKISRKNPSKEKLKFKLQQFTNVLMFSILRLL